MKKVINLLVLLSVTVALWWHFGDVCNFVNFKKVGNVINYTQTVEYDINLKEPYKITYKITFKDLDEGKVWKKIYTENFRSKDKINTTFITRKLTKDKEWYQRESNDGLLSILYFCICAGMSIFFILLFTQSFIYKTPGNGCHFCKNKLCHWHNAPPNPLLKEKFLICLHNIKSVLFRFFS